MPQLKPYESPEAVRGLNTQPLTGGMEALERGGRFAAEEGERRLQAYRQLGEVGQNLYNAVKEHNESQEIIHGTSAMVDLEMKQSQAWSEFSKTPDALDPAKRQTFRDQQNKEVEDFMGSFQTTKAQEHFAEAVGRYQESRFNRETADIANLSAATSVGAIDRVTRGSQSLVEGDPTQLDRGIDQIKSVFAGAMSDPNLPAEGRAKLGLEQQKYVDQVTEAAVHGYIRNDPDPNKANALKMVDQKFGPGTPYYPGPAKLTQWENTAKSEAALQQQQIAIKRTNDERVARATYDNSVTQLVLNPPTDQQGHFDPKAYAAQVSKFATITTPDGGRVMTQGDAQSLMHYQDYLANGVTKASTQGTEDAIFQGMAKGQLPTREQVLGLMSSTTGPHLDRGSGEFILGQISKGPQSDDAKVIASSVKQAESAIMATMYPAGASVPIYTPGADAAVTKFKTWFYPELRQQMAAGHTLDELTNPKSPFYMLSPERLAQFKTTDDDVLKAATGTSQGSLVTKPNLPPLKINIGGQ